jgi:hypothetical protein
MTLNEAEANTPSHETLESGTVIGIRIAPPGLRRVSQFGESRGQEDVVDGAVL